MIALAPGLAEALPSMRTTVATATFSPAGRGADVAAAARPRVGRGSAGGRRGGAETRPRPFKRGGAPPRNPAPAGLPSADPISRGLMRIHRRWAHAASAIAFAAAVAWGA